MSMYNHVITASCNGHIEVVKLLIDSNVNLEHYGVSALDVACIYRQYDVIKLLLERDVCPHSFYCIIERCYSLKEKINCLA
jgi:ankyrin repeat protein